MTIEHQTNNYQLPTNNYSPFLWRLPSAWTPSTGSAQWALGDESTPNTSDYVDSATAADVDRFGMQNMAHTPTTILGIQVVVTARKDDAGARSLKVGVKSSSTVDVSASQSLTAGTDLSYNYLKDVDPATSTAWTKAGIDALLTQIENV